MLLKVVKYGANGLAFHIPKDICLLYNIELGVWVEVEPVVVRPNNALQKTFTQPKPVQVDPSDITQVPTSRPEPAFFKPVSQDNIINNPQRDQPIKADLDQNVKRRVILRGNIK